MNDELFILLNLFALRTFKFNFIEHVHKMAVHLLASFILLAKRTFFSNGPVLFKAFGTHDLFAVFAFYGVFEEIETEVACKLFTHVLL